MVIISKNIFHKILTADQLKQYDLVTIPKLKVKMSNVSISINWIFLQEPNLLVEEEVKPSGPITAGIEFSLHLQTFRKRISTAPITNFQDCTLIPRPIVK